jgi:hypothetical protein
MPTTSRNLATSIQPGTSALSGSDITGLTNEGVIFRIPLEAAKRTKLTTSAGIVIPPSTSFALLWDAATGALSGTVSISKITTE